jgi:hypothetical protein
MMRGKDGEITSTPEISQEKHLQFCTIYYGFLYSFPTVLKRLSREDSITNAIKKIKYTQHFIYWNSLTTTVNKVVGKTCQGSLTRIMIKFYAA